MFILGIETSCDETCISIYDSNLNLMFDKIYSQIDLHKNYGGTVPELASRDHSFKIFKMLLSVLKESKIKLSDISVVAYTKGPGLVGSLLVGASIAKSISFALGIPAIGINHLDAHVNINLYYNKSINYPFLVLLVSGGHTILLKKETINNSLILGETKDDSIGETFDKIARILEFEYPNGVSIENAANKINNKSLKNTYFDSFNINNDTLNFSFSGVKSHVQRIVKELDLNSNIRNELSYQFQDLIVENIVEKCLLAVSKTGITKFLLAGGVAANRLFRTRLSDAMNKIGVSVYYPNPKYCTDNGSMIAFNGFLKYKNNLFDKTFSIKVFPKLFIDQTIST